MNRFACLWSSITRQNPSLKEAIAKAKEAEKALRDNPTVKENLSRFKTAEQKFRDHPSVKDNLEKLREVENKFREDVKDKQVLIMQMLGSCSTYLVVTIELCSFASFNPASTASNETIIRHGFGHDGKVCSIDQSATLLHRCPLETQGEFMAHAEKARQTAQQNQSMFQEKFQDLKQR